MGKKPKSSRRREPPPDDVAYAPPPEQGHDPHWIQLQEQLCGLLCVQVDAPFIDHDHLCPNSVWLVLHLDLVRPTAYVRSTEPLVQRALHALATLCVQSERTRFNEQAYEAFWRRVWTSDVAKETLPPNHAAIAKFIRFARCRGLQVLLSWQGKRFPSALVSHLRAFLTESLDKYAGASDGEGDLAWRPLSVGMVFSDCGLTAADCTALSDLLSIRPSDRDERRLLCGQQSLALLDLSGNLMGTAELQALARSLGSQSRRIDELRLEKTFPTNAADATNGLYTAAFMRVIELLFASRGFGSDHGVALSLAYNTMYDGVHFHALHEALVTVSRPLRALSLAHSWQERSPWSHANADETHRKWFAKICQTSPATLFTEDCALDLSGAGPDLVPADLADFFKHHTDVLVANVPLIQQALANGELVRCRVRNASADCVSTDGACYPHRIVQIRSDGWFVVESSGSGDWRPPSTLSALATKSADILRMRFRSLLCDGEVGPGPHVIVSISRESWTDFIASVGPELRRLAFRMWYSRASYLTHTLPFCPNLVELCVQGSELTDSQFASLFRMKQMHALRVLDVSGSRVSGNFMKHFAEVAGAVELRYLSMLSTHVDLNSMSSLQQALEASNKLEYVELDAIPDAPDGGIVAQERLQTASTITQDHDKTRLRLLPLSTDYEHALLLMIMRRLGRPPSKLVRRVVTRCLELAACEVTRSIVWCAPLPLPRWYPRR